MSTLAHAYIGPTDGSRGGKKPNPSLAANCTPSSTATELDINNTRALIQTGGDMWWDFSIARYEIPKNSGHKAIFAGSLWMGGRDISGQLKVAAQRFRQSGVDFWTGPLSTTGDAEVSPETCREYDKHFLTTRSEVNQFVQWYETGEEDRVNGTNKQEQLFPGYTIPRSILNWPAHGRNYAPYNEDYYLAPFTDRDGDGTYDPNKGDYPAYDLLGTSDCKEKIINIFGDQNLWWVFNDKGNVHTETGAAAIGFEIRAQAFAFSTNDEVNNMTFYNYEIINRSTFTLTDTYFGQWVDADLGCASDDFVGCDVQRGLGYAYNGDENDEDCSGIVGYGSLPPAIGVDFFQGPFQDADGNDNPLTINYAEAISKKGIPYKGIGIGYSDGIVDNERFGMRKFLYHNNARDVRGDPQNGVEYYNYLRSIWRDGSKMVYGGTGHRASGGTVEAEYMFPGDSDPYGWGTGGAPQDDWTEVSAGNTKGDRRFMQSAGPFTLQPGAVNNITVGVVWARTTTGNAEASVAALRKADDKTQALFDNCFKILNGPDAPNLTVRELENELILYIDNTLASNNYNEAYEEQDPTLIPNNPDSLTEDQLKTFKTYKFQGYLIYQIKDNSVSSGDLDNPDKAVLIAQCDLRDTVSRIVNYRLDPDLGVNVPQLRVVGENKGVRHTFRIKQDAFAQGENGLVNHRSYYFMAMAYSYNPNSDNNKFVGSRKSPLGGILPVRGIPRNITVQNGGTKLNAQYGDGVPMTRIEGRGNGGNDLLLTRATVDSILLAGKANHLHYVRGRGPVNIKVVDPLSVKAGDFTIQFIDGDSSNSIGNLDDATWMVYGPGIDTFKSGKTIQVGTETILFDLGLSVSIEQVSSPGSIDNRETDQGVISASIEFADPAKAWISPITDLDGLNGFNWILSGASATVEAPEYNDWNYWMNVTSGQSTKRGVGLDDAQIFERILPGVGPFCLTASRTRTGAMPGYFETRARPLIRRSLFQYNTLQKNDDEPSIGRDSINPLNHLASVDVVFTADKTKWTRCPVFEMADTTYESQGNSVRGQLRDAPSVDKDGNPAPAGASPSTDPENPAYIGAKGMGWFPGYAINVETGERLNMAFSENSYLTAENGRDMLWNPSSRTTEGPLNTFRGGGMHYIYVFRNNHIEDEMVRGDSIIPFLTLDYNDMENRMPAYDAGKFIYNKMKDVLGEDDSLSAQQKTNAQHVFRAGMWTFFASTAENRQLLETEVTVRLRVSKPYQGFGTGKFLSKGDKLERGKKYFVEAGPLRVKTPYGYDTLIHGQWFVADSTGFDVLPNDFNHKDSVNVLQTSINGGMPLYNFSTKGMAPEFNRADLAQAMLDEIRVVPNPYYAYSKYEADKIDNIVRIVNLPKSCTVRIYTVNGILVRTLTKDDETVTYLEWDLKNQSKVPVASGMYIYHVDAPGIGEKVLKWLGVMRPLDLDNF
jgi:hypothetical protein